MVVLARKSVLLVVLVIVRLLRDARSGILSSSLYFQLLVILLRDPFDPSSRLGAVKLLRPSDQYSHGG